MPMGQLSPSAVSAVAAYVWALGHRSEQQCESNSSSN